MTSSIETTILSHLLSNEDYSRRVLPFLKSEYFESKENQLVHEEIYKFIDSYNGLPSKEALHIELEKRSDLNEETWKNTQKVLNTLAVEETDPALFLLVLTALLVTIILMTPVIVMTFITRKSREYLSTYHTSTR